MTVIKSVFWNVAIVTLMLCVKMCSSDSYMEKRRRIIEKEKRMFTGGNIVLNTKEIEVNNILLRLKMHELKQGYDDSTKFLPSQNFPTVKNLIEESNVFKIIKKVPKGCLLHTHLLATVRVDYIIKKYTYKENLYGSVVNGVFKLKFFEKVPDETWKSLEQYRKEDSNFDMWLTNRLTIKKPHQKIENTWTHFKQIFSTLYDMISYKPIFEDYVYQMLNELYLDNVIYTEVRGTFMPLYDLNGKNYTTREFFQIFISVVDKFKREHPKFLGVKYIHSIYRGVDKKVLKEGLQELLKYKRMFPEFISGFDFVGFEEEGKKLVDYHEELLEVQNELKFFLHAGETPWFGHTDLNLIDAILLNSTRIGHGFALTKHPKFLELAKSKNIAIELCPIANQVLGLNNDPRNHPAVNLMSESYPVVICNDDPSVWNATGLSYDFYVVFMSMTSENSGLEVLKKFALDSIEYSVMDDKGKAVEQFEEDWEKFLDEILEIKNDLVD